MKKKHNKKESTRLPFDEFIKTYKEYDTADNKFSILHYMGTYFFRDFILQYFKDSLVVMEETEYVYFKTKDTHKFENKAIDPNYVYTIRFGLPDKMTGEKICVFEVKLSNDAITFVLHSRYDKEKISISLSENITTVMSYYSKYAVLLGCYYVGLTVDKIPDSFGYFNIHAILELLNGFASYIQTSSTIALYKHDPKYLRCTSNEIGFSVVLALDNRDLIVAIRLDTERFDVTASCTAIELKGESNMHNGMYCDSIMSPCLVLPEVHYLYQPSLHKIELPEYAVDAIGAIVTAMSR